MVTYTSRADIVPLLEVAVALRIVNQFTIDCQSKCHPMTITLADNLCNWSSIDVCTLLTHPSKCVSRIKNVQYYPDKRCY